MPHKPPTHAQMMRAARGASGARDPEPRERRRADPTQVEADRLRTSGAWKRLRDSILRGEPLCRVCRARGETTPATEVDHIVPIRSRLEDAFDPANLQPICRACHATKSGAERSR